MRLLLAGNDITVIALWLGHEQITTTNIYLHADMTHKQQAIDRTKPITETRPLPPHRHAPRVPRSALIMPTSRPQTPLSSPSSTDRHNAHIGIFMEADLSHARALQRGFEAPADLVAVERCACDRMSEDEVVVCLERGRLVMPVKLAADPVGHWHGPRGMRRLRGPLAPVIR